MSYFISSTSFLSSPCAIIAGNEARRRLPPLAVARCSGPGCCAAAARMDLAYPCGAHPSPFPAAASPLAGGNAATGVLRRAVLYSGGRHSQRAV